MTVYFPSSEGIKTTGWKYDLPKGYIGTLEYFEEDRDEWIAILAATGEPYFEGKNSVGVGNDVLTRIKVVGKDINKMKVFHK